MRRKKNGHEFTSETGRAATKGRKPGSKNKLTRESWTMIDQLFADYRKHGKDILRILRAENPAAYLRLVYDLAGKLALDDPAEQELPKILVIRWLDDGDEEPPLPMVKGDDNVVKMIDVAPTMTRTDPAA
jgi:hypothetical protein